MSRMKNGFSINTKNTFAAAEATAEAALDVKERIFLGSINVTLVDTARVFPDPNNPRTLAINKEEILSGFNYKNPDYVSLKKKIENTKKIAEIDQIEKLANSIKQNGLLNAIVVYKEGNRLHIVTGERRYLSCLLLGYESIPAKILNKKPNNFQLRVIQWAENSDREDLTAWDRLDNVKVIVESYQEENTEILSARKLAKIINIGKSQSAKYLQLLKEPADSNLIKSIKQNKIISLNIADFISSIQDGHMKDALIASAETGSRLSELQKQLQKLQEKRIAPQKSRNIKLKFPPPKKTAAASLIIKNLLESSFVAEHKEKFTNINLNNIYELNKAWEKLITIFEEHVVEA